MNIEISSKDSKFYEEFIKAFQNMKNHEIELFGKIWAIGSVELFPPFEVDVALIFIRDVPIKEKIVEKIVYRTVSEPCDLPHYPSYPAYPNNPYCPQYPDTTPCHLGYPPGIFFCKTTSDLNLTGAADLTISPTDVNLTSCVPSYIFDFHGEICKH